MAIPDFQTLMLPFLKLHADKHDHSGRDLFEPLATQFNLTETERRQLLPSGTQTVLLNRMGWAKSYLAKAGLLEPSRRGVFHITERGLEVLAKNPPRINIAFLKQFESFLAFRAPRETQDAQPAEPQQGRDDMAPDEALEIAYQQIREALAAEILQNLKGSSPNLFERIVVDVIVGMGYGGSRKDAGEAIGRSGDEGIDGIIKQDRLGLDTIYIQAKRWKETPVGRPEIQKFAGALQGQRAKRGIFITTSTFSRDARDYAAHLETKIVLIDGEQLADLMIDHNIGVTPIAVYETKRLDSDYFEEG
jgi:restriction system protein